jgi:hypothetical protein
MPEKAGEDTSSWCAYQEFMAAVTRFLEEITVRDGEVWFRNSVCLGSDRCAWLRAPLDDAPDCVVRAVGGAYELVGNLLRRLQIAIEAGRHPDEKIRDVIGSNEAGHLSARTDSLERLAAEVQGVRQHAPFDHHPSVLLRLREILSDRVGPGNAGIRVTVTKTYVA